MIILIFFAALSFRLLLFNTIDRNVFSYDGIAYHNVAINIVENNIYSEQINEPFNQYFFREPGYPLFLAGIYKDWKSFRGDLTYINAVRYENDPIKYISEYNEIKFAKLVQIVIDSVGVCLFYIIGDAPRRFLPALPYTYMFAFLGVIYIYTKLTKTNSSYIFRKSSEVVRSK